MSNTHEATNKALVLEAFDTLFNLKDYAKAAEFWSDQYVQHSAHVPAGRDGLFGLVKATRGIRFEYDMIAAEGDFVWLHSRYPSDERAALIAVDIVRIANGRLVEHWDVLQDEVGRDASAGGHPMFGDRFPD